nr:MAG TPA: hypothetical protein [Caudoviricetes sp.]
MTLPAARRTAIQDLRCLARKRKRLFVMERQIHKFSDRIRRKMNAERGNVPRAVQTRGKRNNPRRLEIKPLSGDQKRRLKKIRDALTQNFRFAEIAVRRLEYLINDRAVNPARKLRGTRHREFLKRLAEPETAVRNKERAFSGKMPRIHGGAGKKIFADFQFYRLKFNHGNKLPIQSWRNRRKERGLRFRRVPARTTLLPAARCRERCS